MAKDNKMLKGMLIGAAIGAAVTLFDRKTRQSVAKSAKEYGIKTWHSVKRPKETIEKVTDKLTTIGEQLQQTADEALYIMDKIAEIAKTEERTEQQEKNDSTY